jgi:hypothetical protein
MSILYWTTKKDNYHTKQLLIDSFRTLQNPIQYSESAHASVQSVLLTALNDWSCQY